MRKRRPTHQQIAARAYQIYLECGCQSGQEVDHWLQAEYELTQIPVRKLARVKPTIQPEGRGLIAVVRSALRSPHEKRQHVQK